ncbi:MAG: hypothetical protein PW788_14110 [Micavibrio sp.]|nr:hypothetical protein [Micavibrio sp.]
MPSYLGLDQKQLIASINDGLALLESYSPGPVCQSHIDDLRTPDAATGVSRLGAITAATDDVALAKAVRGSGINWVFSRMNDVLQFHAEHNTGGTGTAVYQSLAGWNATGAAMTMEYNAVDEECDIWLALARAELVEMTEENAVKLTEYANEVSKDSKSVTTAIGAMAKLINGAQGNASEQALKDVYLSLSLHERHITTTVLHALTVQDKEPVDVTPAIGRYGVVIDDLTQKKVNWTDASIKAIRNDVEKVLGPFYETDEVNMTGIGMVTNDRTAPDLGIVFMSSRRAAQAVADAMPGHTVKSDNGNVLPPAAAPQPPKPGFSL